MITKRTVLILGAGASVPYKFPSGLQLIQVICSKLSSEDSSEFRLLSQCTPKIRDIIRFKDALSRSGQPSVDAFLEHRTEFIEIGKTAIALALLPFERTAALFEGKRQENWYQYLFGRVSTWFDKLGENKLSIITFNYDRSLEHYFFTALKNSHAMSENACAEKLSSIPIIHVHGKLGPLPWEVTVNPEAVASYSPPDNAVPYDSFSDPRFTSHKKYERYKTNWLTLARNNIKIIHESIENDEEFDKAHELLKAAEKVYFLGFGYHEINLKRLNVELLCDPKEPMRYISGTIFNLSHQQEQLVRTKNWWTPTRTILLHKKTIYEFFHENEILD